MTHRPVVHLVDGSGYIFRAYFAIRPMSTRAGLPTNAVLGFARMLIKLIKDEHPTSLVIAFDAARKNFRHEIFAEYKATREAPPEDLVPQFALIRELVAAMDVLAIEREGYEADDVLATLVDQAVAGGNDVVVVTGDKDLMQLVTPQVTVFDPLKDKRYGRDEVIERFGVPPELVVDVLALAGDASDNIPGVPKVGEKTAAKLVAAYGDLEAVIAALGEPGKKLKAAELSVLENAATARLSKRLATLEHQTPVQLDLDAWRYQPPRAEKLGPFLRRIEATGLLRELGLDAPPATTATRPTPAVAPTPANLPGAAPDAVGSASAPSPAPSPSPSPSSTSTSTSTSTKRNDAETTGAATTPVSEDARPPGQQSLRFAPPTTSAPQAAQLDPRPRGALPEPGGPLPQTVRELADLTTPASSPIDRSAYRTIYDPTELAPLVAEARRCRALAIDLETTSLDANRADIVGIAMAAGNLPAVYVPVAHRYLGVPKQAGRAAMLDYLRPILTDPDVKKVGQNIKYDLLVFARAGVELRGIGDDSMIAAYVLNPSRLSYSLDALAHEKLDHQTIRYSEVTGTGKTQIGFDEVELEAATRYAAEDADVALRLCRLLAREVDAAGLTDLYRGLELPLIPVLARMERAGIRVDPERLRELGLEFGDRLAAIEAHMQGLIGEKVNLASPKQLQELLFTKLGLKAERRTKTGYSTDQDVLETLAREHEVPRIILEHRMLSKLKSTYVDALARMVNPETGRVHTSYNQTGAATGRLSSSDPNLQNIPVRSEDGRRIRAAFVAEPGNVLISADYSQIELRVMAHLSGDPAFIAAFAQGQDIHLRTAQEIITGGAAPDAEARRRAKAINFGILYGLSEFGLSRQLGIPRAEAAAYIKLYFSRYPCIREFLDATIEQARVTGYVQTLARRRRYLPELLSQNRTVRQGAERIAMNTPIQGSAADLIKMAMLRVACALDQHPVGIQMLLQVHDELVLEAPEAQAEVAVALVREAMTGAMQLAVPLVVDVGIGHDWASAH
jgi:DNA polymerase-1